MLCDVKCKLKIVLDYVIFVFLVYLNCMFCLYFGVDECIKIWLLLYFFIDFEFYEKYLWKKYISLSYYVFLK